MSFKLFDDYIKKQNETTKTTETLIEPFATTDPTTEVNPTIEPKKVLFKIEKGLATNLAKNRPYAQEGSVYFTTNDAKLYIDISGHNTESATIGINRIPLNAYASDVLKASTMPTNDDIVYPILAFKITDTAKNLVEAKYGSIGFKNGALVIRDNASKDEILIENKTSGNAIKIENTSTSGYGIEITGSGKGIKVAQDPTENLELATKQYVDNKTELETINVKAGDNITIEENGNDLVISGAKQYTHPTFTAHTAAAVKVGNDSLGHVVLGSALTKSDVGLGNVDNTSDANKPLSTAVKNEFKKYLPLAGGTMSGDINMENCSLINVNTLTFISESSQTPLSFGPTYSFTSSESYQTDYDSSTDFSLTAYNQKTQNGIELNFKPDCIQFAKASANLEEPITLRGIKDPVADSDAVNLKYLDTQLSTLLGANDAMLFKGTVASNADLPTTHEVGWTYRVNVAGTYAGQKCEVGDLVICIKDGITASNSDWTIGQTNTDVFAGATASAAGSTGLVPSPSAGSQTKFLRADGTWDDPSWNYLSDKPTQLNLQAGSNIDITEDNSNITIGVANDVFASKDHNHDSSYVKKTGDTMSGYLTNTTAGGAFVLHNNSTNQNYIALSRDSGGAQLYGLWDYLKSKWIIQSDGTTAYFDGYPITTNGKKGIPVVTTDFGALEIGQYIDFHQTGTEDYNGRLSCQTDWNFFGKNKLYLIGNTTTADDKATTLYLGSKDTDTGITDYSYIAAYSGHNTGSYGGKMVINGGQALIIGSGESAGACYANVAKSINTEDMYLTSDANIYFYTNCNTWANHTTAVKIDTAGKLWGAVWNDYAEMREGNTIEAGRCVTEIGDDTLALSTKRMQPGANITSDTFGFAIGETDKCKTPIAVSGRVLAYGYESREEFKKNIGRPVCSGPNGTVSIMTDKEYKDKGYCAIGTISAVPDYEEWGTGKVKVDGRIWIKVF